MKRGTRGPYGGTEENPAKREREWKESFRFKKLRVSGVSFKGNDKGVLVHTITT
jgi:hypothetical protein